MNETIVDIPGIGQVAFPATMSEQEINAAAQRLYNESQQQAQPQAPQQPVATQPTPRPPAPAQPASFMQRVAQAAQLEPSTQSMIRGAVQDPINAIRQVFGGTATRAKIAEEEKAYQAARKEAGKSGLDGFRLVGNVLSPATLAGGAAGVKATDFAAKWSTLFGSKVAKGVGAGAGSAVLLPTTTPQEEQDSFFLEKAKDVGFSGLAGGVMSKIGSALTPQLRPGVSEQLAQGVEVPAGQAYGGVPGWVFRQMENIGFGPSMKTIRQSFTKAAGNEVLKSIDQTLPPTVKDGMQASGYVERQIGKFYDDAFDNIGRVIPDSQFANDIGNVALTAKEEMSDKATRMFSSAIKANIVDKFKLGQVPSGAVAPQGMVQIPSMDGTKLKEIDKFLKKQVQKYGKGTDADSIALAAAYEDTLNAFRAYVGRVDNTGLIAKADEAWAKLYRFADASQKAFKEGGDFSAEQLAAAAVRQGTTLRAGAGEAPMQQFAQQAIDVLGVEKDILPAGYRQAVIAGKVAGGTALSLFAPQVAIPILVSSGLTYKAAERLMKNPSALRKAMESAIQKIGPQATASFLAEAQRAPLAEEE
jgi:hypothetical protein